MSKRNLNTLEHKTHKKQKVFKYPIIKDSYIHNIEDNNEYPSEIEITGHPNINGVYKYYGNGGSGIVYHNEKQNKILKILYFNNIQSFEKEITFQTLSGKHAPKIYAIIKKTFAGQPSYGFIMDFMEEGEKLSLTAFLEDPANWNKLFNFLFDVIQIKKLNLFADWMGQGDESTHLYLKNDEIVMIDYGNVSKIRPTKDYGKEETSYNEVIESIIENKKLEPDKINNFRTESISVFNKLKADPKTKTASTRHLRNYLITTKNSEGGSRKIKTKKHKKSKKKSKKKSSRKNRHKTKKK